MTTKKQAIISTIVLYLLALPVGLLADNDKYTTIHAIVCAISGIYCMFWLYGLAGLYKSDEKRRKAQRVVKSFIISLVCFFILVHIILFVVKIQN